MGAASTETAEQRARTFWKKRILGRRCSQVVSRLRYKQVSFNGCWEGLEEDRYMGMDILKYSIVAKIYETIGRFQLEKFWSFLLFTRTWHLQWLTTLVVRGSF